MGIRVEPHAYPTIPGQATNEGGGALPVEYLNLDALSVTYTADWRKSGDTLYIELSRSPRGTLRKVIVSGITVNDITGLTVLTEVKMGTITMAGTIPGSPKKRKVTIPDQAFALVTTSQPNRTIDKVCPETDMIFDPDVMDASFIYAGIEITGSATVTVKVVNAMGAVLQMKSKTVEVKQP